MLMVAARTIGGPAYLEMIKEMDRELTKVINDFDCAVGIEALHLANDISSELSILDLSIVDPQWFGAEQVE